MDPVVIAFEPFEKFPLDVIGPQPTAPESVEIPELLIVVDVKFVIYPFVNGVPTIPILLPELRG